MLPTTDEPDEAFELIAAGDAALRRLKRPLWPALPISFGEPIDVEPAAVGGCSILESMRAGHAAARRFTCALSPDRFENFARGEAAGRTLIVHAIDAALGMPLLLGWTLAHVDLLRSFRARAAAELECHVVFVLPDDLPAAYRRALDALGETRWVSPRYPAGSWRLMPHVVRTPVESTLTLDAIAAVDLAIACNSGEKVRERPVAFETPGNAPPLLRRIARGTTLGELGEPGGRWSIGAPLATHRVDVHYVLGDGELAFYREDVHPAPPASACVRCGACVAICPTRCDPVALLGVAARPSRRAAERAGLAACIDCGLCTAVCPSAIPLHTVIESLKRGLVPREPA